MPPKTLLTTPSSLYSAFDLFPSRKGAAIHIDRFAGALFEEMNGGLLYVNGNDSMMSHQVEGNIETIRFTRPIPNFLRRSLSFGKYLGSILDECDNSLKLCHFRDIWSGSAILARNRNYKTIFEVNGLPSIELQFTYRKLAPQTIETIRRQELFCMIEADHIVTPSQSIMTKVESYGIPAEKITVIPNGADISTQSFRRPDFPPRYIIYFGALQPWQGVEVLLRALFRLRDLEGLFLVICASSYSRRAKFLQKFAEKLGCDNRVIWHFGLSEEELAPWRSNALLSIAPLTECARNIEQGCAPLKILESMASGVPVIASNLPSVREIMIDGEHGRLIPPDRVGDLARIIRVLLLYPDRLRVMGAKAQHKIREDFLWEKSLGKLKNLYRKILQE